MLVLGLDCVPPGLVFERFRDRLPNLNRLIAHGLHGRLRSVHPPITVPAWTSMFSGKSPGELGLYGFHHRKLGSYHEKYLALSDSVRAQRIWEALSAQGRRVIVLGVPQTFPIRPVNGFLVSSFLTPNTGVQFTHPPELKHELDHVSRFDGQFSERSRGYMLDVENFRTEDKERVLREIYEMTEKQFAVLRYLLTTRTGAEGWDLAVAVFMGPDRLHHGFWKYFDEAHKDYIPGNRYEDAIQDYYEYLDEEIGRVLAVLDEDVRVFVLSDHGVKKLDGCICINEWLRRQGYLKLKEEPEGMTPFDESLIDWEHTQAWGWGGYYGRIFINKQGREPQGRVSPAEYEALRDELISKLEALTDGEGRGIGTRVYRPEELYRTVRGDPPDLFVYFGDLDWRSSAAVGCESIHLAENDTGPDHANHDWDGIFIYYDPRRDLGGRELEGLELPQVGPTLARLLRVPLESEFQPIPEVIADGR